MRWRSNGDIYFNPRALGDDASLADKYGEMLARGPLHHSAFGGWFVCGYELSRELLRAPQLQRIHPAAVMKQLPGAHPSVDLFEASLFGKESENDMVIRNTMRRVFSRAEVSKHRLRAEIRAREMLSALPVGQSQDAVEGLALPFTLQVLCDLLGVPRDYGTQLRKFTQLALLLFDTFPARLADIIAADEITPIAAGIFHEAIPAAADGTLAAALRELVAAGEISADEAMANLAIAFAAGHDTTISLIARILHLLTERPELGIAVSDRTVGVDRFVEEAMRYFSPVQIAPRVAVENLEVGDARIEAGTHVMFLIGAANRDPAIFHDPHEFRLDRSLHPRPLGFGYGVHLCVGEQLARLHTEVLVDIAIREFPDIVCRHDGVSWRATATIRFPEAVEITRRVSEAA